MICVENLTKIFKSKYKQECVAVDNISFDLPDSGLVFIVGKSGSGKTTLLSLLGNLDYLTSGEIIVDGNNFNELSENELSSYRNERVGFIFQDYHLIEELNIFDNIKLSLDLKGEKDDEKIITTLKKVGLEGYENRMPKELSGGEKQRVAIARAIVKNSNIILADETTGNLDEKTTYQILDILKELSKTKLVVIVSHDKQSSYKYADRIIELKKGKIISDLIAEDEVQNCYIKDRILYVKNMYDLSCEDKTFIANNSNEFSKIVNFERNFVKNSTNFNEKAAKKEIKNAKFSFKSKTKISLSFIKKRIAFTLLFSVCISLIMSILTLSGSIVKFDKNNVYEKELHKDDEMFLNYTKLVERDKKDEMNLRNPISEEEFLRFKNSDYSGEMYKLSNFRIGNFSIKDDNYNAALFQTSKLGKNPFISGTRGTLICNEIFLQEAFGIKDLFLAKAKIEDPAGFYITDYTADSILKLCKTKLSYDDICKNNLVPKNVISNVYINGIIKTNYQEKIGKQIKYILDHYDDESALTNFAQTKEYANYYDYMNNYLLIDYTFNENFIEDLKTSSINFSSRVVVNKKENIEGKKISFVYNEELKDDEIALSFDTKSSLANYIETDETTGDEYIDLSFNSIVDIDKSFSHRFKVCNSKLYYNFVSKNIKQELNELCLYFNEIYFENTLDSSKLNQIASTMNFVPLTIFRQTIDAMSYAVLAFGDVFQIIFFIMIVISLVLLVSYTLKYVKNSKYKIGVMKSLGTKNIDLVHIFSLDLLLVLISSIVLSICLSNVFVDLANVVLANSIQNLANESLFYKVDLLYLKPFYLLINSLIMIVIVFISFLVEVIKLRKIKPINIIKAKE